MNKKPKLKVIGKDGNAFNILGEAKKVSSENKLDWKVIRSEAMGGDYNNLLRVMDKYFTVC